MTSEQRQLTDEYDEGNDDDDENSDDDENRIDDGDSDYSDGEVDFESTGEPDLTEIDLGESVMCRMRCAAHTLQLAIQHVLKIPANKALMKTVRLLVKKLRTQAIMVLIKEKGLRKPVLDCVRRWSSTYLMLQRVIEAKNVCRELSKSNKKEDTKLKLTDYEWQQITDLYKALTPAKVAITRLQEESLTPGDCYSVWMNCRMETQEVKNNYAKQLVENIKSREMNLFTCDGFLAALYLDGRYNLLLSKSAKKLWERAKK